ncbi:programmed cell death protein 2 [Xylariaceae sp. FL1272]|nr:programmed cell death protein 2 [Xylariaceae sp. FL1272]
MASYDSDSSGGEEDDFTETNVLLGYASKDFDGDATSRLGGEPEWLDPSTPPSAALARCKICKDLMVLLLQLNGELPDRFPGHERRLFVFACKKKSCQRRDGSIRALRSLRVAPGSKAAPLKEEKKKEEKEKATAKEAPKPATNLGETLFGAKTLGGGSGGANPFASTSSNQFVAGSNSPSSNPFAASSPFTFNPAETSSPTETQVSSTEPAPEPPKSPTSKMKADLTSLPKTFASALSLNTPTTPPPAPEPWPTTLPKPYPTSYLSEAEYETLDPTPAPIPQATRLDVDDDKGPTGGKEDKEAYESTMDTTFQKFADRLSQNPEQSIRYEFGGTPLLYSKTDAVGKLLAPSDTSANGGSINAIMSSGSSSGVKGIPQCANCSGGRVFEVQLCPHAIIELEAEELSLEGMDWGTVIVGVCERDCQARGVEEGGVGYVEEWCGVQWEEVGSSAPGRR